MANNVKSLLTTGDVKSLQPTGTLAAITTTSNNSPTASPFLQNTPLLQPSPAFRTSRSASTSNLSSPMRTGALDGAAGGTTKVEYPLSDHGMLDRSDDDGDVNDNGHGGVGRARRSGTSRRSTAKNTLPLSDTELEVR